MIRRLAMGLVALVALSSAEAADSQQRPADEASIGRELDAIREQLVALDIEKALFALNEFLERSDLPETTRVAGLDLRAQAHVAADHLDAAENDYRDLLALRPGYAPSPEVTSKRAMERFLKLRATTIGTIRLDVDPKDASLTVDGRPVSFLEDGLLAAVAGERRLSFSRKGFDAQDVDVDAIAGKETPVRVRLVPNARSLVARTDIDGVAVTLDGAAVGFTRRRPDATGEASSAAELVIEDVAIGEHEIRFAKPCFAGESLEEMVSVDLVDRTPKPLRIVAMRPSRTRVTAEGAHYDGELRVDGERAASLPLTSFAICPGQRLLEVVASGRVVWSGVLTAEESDMTLDLTPRPNAVLVGADWPAAWALVAASWSLRGRVDPPAGANLETAEGWEAVPLPSGTDLAVAVIPGAGVAGAERIVLYSPALNEVEDRASPPHPSRPSWIVATLGGVLVDGGERTVLFAATSASGPAATAGIRPGDRLVAIAGRQVSSALSAREVIAASGPGATLVLDIASPADGPRKVSCGTVAEPATAAASGDVSSRIVRAAFASVEAAAGGQNAALAFANLAGLLERSGRTSAALDAWRRVRAIGEGGLRARAAYADGVGLEAAGKRADAIEAFGRAKSEALGNSDLALAAAAADRLADYGVAPR